jgi:hypothetical protein
MRVKMLLEFAAIDGSSEAAPDCATDPAEAAYPEKDKPKAATATINNRLAGIRDAPQFLKWKTMAYERHFLRA